MYCYDIVKAEVGYCAFQDQQSRDVNGIGHEHISHTGHCKPDELEEDLPAGFIPGGIDPGQDTCVRTSRKFQSTLPVRGGTAKSNKDKYVAFVLINCFHYNFHKQEKSSTNHLPLICGKRTNIMQIYSANLHHILCLLHVRTQIFSY